MARVEDIYTHAWQLLDQKLESKTGWGKNEVKQLMKDCLIISMHEVDKGDDHNEISG